MRFFANTAHPDEHVIHTIVGNSNFADRIEHGLTYADWSDGSPNPMTLGHTQICNLTHRDHVMADDRYGRGMLLFARKFPDNSEALTRLIDDWIAHK